MSMHSLFATDKDLEKHGVALDYGDFKITIARAGGANKKYERVLAFKAKPYRRAIESETMDSDRGIALLQEVYIETIILNWEVKRDEKWVVGIDPPIGEDISGVSPFDKENMLRAWKEVPDLFLDIQAQANKSAMYRADLEEIEVKN